MRRGSGRDYCTRDRAIGWSRNTGGQLRVVDKILPDSEMRLGSRVHVTKRARTCIVTGELAGPDFNGGIGTTNRALAIVLRRLGYDVEILYTRVDHGKPFSARGQFADHVKAYQRLGIRLSCIDNQGRWNDWEAKSYLSMQHLLRHRYDLVFFDDTHGTAYYPLLARRTGNADLRGTIMCVTAHSATQWIADLNQAPVTTFEELRLIEMERRSIELADVVRAPSAYILEKYRSYGWAVPENSPVLPNFTLTDGAAVPSARHVDVEEFVFFGRLESRKGLWMFCRALDRVKYKLVGKQVSFLGKPTVENGRSTDEALLTYAAGWPFPIRLLVNFDQQQALSYLRGNGRLAVMASPEDNSPSAWLECLGEGIPFIACAGSGGEELVNDECRHTNLVLPTVDSLAAKLMHVLEHGATTGESRVNEPGLQATYAEWIGRLLKSDANKGSTARMASRPDPILIVVVPPEISAQKAGVEFVRTSEGFQGRIEIDVLAARPHELRKELMRLDASLPVTVSGLAELGKIARSLKYRNHTVLGLCHITQVPSPVWFDRARECFGSGHEISALTGMVGVSAENASIRERYFSDPDGAPTIERYLTGNASALFSLLPETNSGFILMRSNLLPGASDMSPLDNQLGRLKRMEDWIHEIVLSLRSRGARFELVPDLTVEQAPRENPSEVFRAASFLRSQAQTSLGHARGTDQWLITRLAIDAGLERERARVAREYLSMVETRIGRASESAPDMSANPNFEQLAMFAHACGQIELAVDLSARLAISKGATKFADIADFVRSAVDAQSLFEEFVADRHKTLNLDDDYSLRVHEESQRFEMHANPSNKGIAAIVFPSVDLSKVDHFVCELQVLQGAAPIRFRVELFSVTKSRLWSFEKILRGGEELVWESEVPSELRASCRVLLGVEMADREGPSAGAFARWTNPRFVRHS
jgi:glycosyltransferase involved in cell wall biosynthesis